MQGTSFNSHWSATGLVVSGAPSATIRSTPSRSISSTATSAARFELDCVSLQMISKFSGAPLLVMPAMAARAASMMYWSASPKPASGLVAELTKPILNDADRAEARLVCKIIGAD